MIEAWFNETGYFIKSLKGESKFIYDLSPTIIENASALYTCRWMIFNQMMEVINSLNDASEDGIVVLGTDSRLVEELQGEVTPENEYAKSSLRYFIKNDYVKFRKVVFRKSAATTINGKLSEPINSERLK